MKYLIAFAAAIVTACALPTDFRKDGSFKDASMLIGNGTRNIPYGQAGFATLNGGTIGGAGGAVWTVWDGWALRDAVSGNDRRIVYIRGRIDLTILFTASPGVALQVGNYKSIIGGDGNAMIFGGGLRIARVSQVIVQNLKIHNALSYAPGEQPNGAGGILSQVPGAWSTIDAIGIEQNAENVWVDHCEFADDPWVSSNTPETSRRHDGQIDITRGASLVSISNNIFRNHFFVTLVGNDDYNGAQDSGRLKVTFYLNWYQGTNQRMPRVRFGEVHVLNNLFTDLGSYGIGAGTAAQIYAERNMFVNTRRAWVLAYVVDPVGKVFNMNNWLDNSSHDSGVPGDVTWNPAQYYWYSAMAAANVGNHVRANAGTW